MYTNPRRIFHIAEQPNTWIEVDPDESWEIRAVDQFSRCAWTPFEGWKVRGRVRQVMLRGKEAFREGKVLAPCGSGHDLRAI